MAGDKSNVEKYAKPKRIRMVKKSNENEFSGEYYHVLSDEINNAFPDASTDTFKALMKDVEIYYLRCCLGEAGTFPELKVYSKRSHSDISNRIFDESPADFTLAQAETKTTQLMKNIAEYAHKVVEHNNAVGKGASL